MGNKSSRTVNEEVAGMVLEREGALQRPSERGARVGNGKGGRQRKGFGGWSMGAWTRNQREWEIRGTQAIRMDSGGAAGVRWERCQLGRVGAVPAGSGRSGRARRDRRARCHVHTCNLPLVFILSRHYDYVFTFFFFARKYVFRRGALRTTLYLTKLVDLPAFGPELLRSLCGL